MTDRIAALQAQIGGPRDGALLRFALGSALLDAKRTAEACEAFHAAVDFDPDYSAAWKLLGKALLAHEDFDAAAEAWRLGIDAAARRGDKQAEKEMQVFLRRLQKPRG
ncbi:tetratricopeptide repeat protein [Oleiagrimonas soli]|uniref:TPR repeat-containing protein n=1 Tax=Oleiagrimonas soli TaxID=1543381 RepID=A0A099CSV4_9GAMM|nr:tetratricopeptide repeat protein [Oleiagrimonas soli]KGI76781.1 TPR repeat-containing protein [Oleiagrimonas soli]MBB6184975.1 tetratricopeptide (TPR) repeat protein [Oleiagrimonas soli]